MRGTDEGDHPVTPDGRYLVVRGRLWRRANPALDPAARAAHVAALMAARRAVAAAKRSGRGTNDQAMAEARAAVDAAKRALGERGPVWWDDAPDENRRMARTTRYAAWFTALGERETPEEMGREG